MEVHVPHDVILNDILPRVPTESVCRFKCVSKEWHSFLTSDMFQTMHAHKRHHKNNDKLLILSKTKTSCEFTTIDCEEPPSVKGLTPTRRPLPPFEGITPSSSCSILASFHGLVCLGIYEIDQYVYSGLILWNPLTNEYKRLSKSDSHKECNNIQCCYSDFGLYYSCCEDDYKLLFVSYYDDNVYIYSLKSDSWRKVDVFQNISLLYPGCWSKGTYLNENLYFLQQGLDKRLRSIIRFDTKTERLSKIETPNVDANSDAWPYFAAIMVKSDCIHVCVKYSYNIEISGFEWTCIKLWKLDEHGNMKEVVTYQLRPQVYDIASSLIPFHGNMKEVVTYQLRPQVYDIASSLIPFHLMKNGNWLMRSCDNHHIYTVDLRKKMHIKDKGKGNIYDDFEYAKVRVLDDNTNIVRYIETFVSPNRYLK